MVGNYYACTCSIQRVEIIHIALDKQYIFCLLHAIALTSKSKLVTAVVVSAMVAAIAAPVMATMYSYCWRCSCMWEEENCKKRALNPALWLQGGRIPQQAAVVTI